MVAFQDALPAILPVDLAAFLRHARPQMHPAALVVLAMLWLPAAQASFVTALAGQTELAERLTGNQLAAAVLQTLQESQLAPGIGVHNMHEQGMQRCFGPSRVATWLGVQRVSGAQGQRRGPADSRAADARCQELLDALPGQWPLPATLEAFEGQVGEVDTQLRTLPSWTGFGGTYVRPHILRKIAMFWLEQGGLAGEPSPTSTVMARFMPDELGLLANLPPSWPVARITALTPMVKPPLLSMWACLFHAALRSAKAREWASRGDSIAFSSMATALQGATGCPPTPAQVIAAALCGAGAKSAKTPTRSASRGISSVSAKPTPTRKRPRLQSGAAKA